MVLVVWLVRGGDLLGLLLGGVRSGCDHLEALFGRLGYVSGGVEKEDLTKSQPWLK
jgi:hypothetical protein